MATANSKLKIDYGFDSFGTSNVTGDFRVTGNVFFTGTILSSITTNGDLIPVTNGLQLGNTTNRWTVLANSGNFSNTLTVVGSATLQDDLTVTKTINASNNVVITGYANAIVSVNSALLSVGTSFIANTTGAYHTGTINSASVTLSNSTVTGIVTANNSGVYPSSNTVGTALGSSTQRWVVNGNTGNFSGQLTVSGNSTLTGNATLSGTLQTIAGNVNFDSGTLFVDAANNRVGIANTTPGVALEVTGAANVSVSVNSALLTVGTSFTANTSGAYPGSNTVGAALGSSTQRWIVNANTINASGLITGSAGANITGQSNLADVTISGNLTVSGTTTYINTTTLNVGDNIVTLNADLDALVAPTENAGLEVNRGSAANVSFLWNESSDSWTQGNTNITGYANATVSLSVGTSFIANTTGAYHTGTINAASFTTTNLKANNTGLIPLSNTEGIVLGSATNRFNLTANTGSFSGTVTGTVANMSTSVNSALLTVGTSFIANTSGAIVPSHLIVSGGNATGEGGQIVLGYGNNLASSITGLANNTFSFDIVGGNTASTPILRAYFQNNDGTTTYAFSAANTGRVHVGSSAEQTDSTFKVTGSANVTTTLNVITSLTANAFTANASGAYHTGTINAASFTTTNLKANNTGLIPLSNTEGIVLGSATNRFNLTANTGNFSGLITGTAGTTITGQVNASTGFGSGTIGAASNGLFANATSISVGNTSVNVAITPTSIDLGTQFDANTSGVYHTGTINAASFTTTNFTANNTGSYPLSNTVGSELGAGTKRWTLNASNVALNFLSANASQGTAGAVLTSGGTSTNAYWADAGVTITDDVATAAVRYVTFTSSSSGQSTGLNVSTTKLTYNPSTGALTSTSHVSSSDERLKDDIVTIPNALDKVNRLRGVSYTHKQTKGKYIGVIAQETEEVIPEVVVTDSEGWKSVSYGHIVGLLIEAIKEQQIQIDALSSKINNSIIEGK